MLPRRRLEQRDQRVEMPHLVQLSLLVPVKGAEATAVKEVTRAFDLRGRRAIGDNFLRAWAAPEKRDQFLARTRMLGPFRRQTAGDQFGETVLLRFDAMSEFVREIYDDLHGVMVLRMRAALNCGAQLKRGDGFEVWSY